MRSRVKALDILRGVMISYWQDRYRVSPDAATMQKIIEYVDVKLCDISEQEAADLI